MKKFALLAGFASLALAASVSSAAIVITEVMSSSGTGGTPDWFVVTNTGAASENVAGFRYDDSTFGVPATVIVDLLGVSTIAPGESVIFFESAAPLIEAPQFRTFWNLPGSVQVGTFTGSGVSLGSGGDAVVIFTGSNVEVTRVTFGAATTGSSFVRTGTGTVLSTLAQVGVDGAYSVNAAFALNPTPVTNIASPGLIPEPTVLGLIAAGSLAMLRRRRA